MNKNIARRLNKIARQLEAAEEPLSWTEGSQKIELVPTHGAKGPPYAVIANGDRLGKVIKSSGVKFAGVLDDGNEQGPWKNTMKEAAEWVVFGE